MLKLKRKWLLSFLLVIIILAIVNVAMYIFSSSKKDSAKELVILTPNSQTILTGTIPAFEEKYGVKVRLIQGGTSTTY